MTRASSGSGSWTALGSALERDGDGAEEAVRGYRQITRVEQGPSLRDVGGAAGALVRVPAGSYVEWHLQEALSEGPYHREDPEGWQAERDALTAARQSAGIARGKSAARANGACRSAASRR